MVFYSCINTALYKCLWTDGYNHLRLDNTGALVVEVNPSLRCNQMCDNVELYIKLKLCIFSIICYYSHSQVMLYSQILNSKVIFQLFFCTNTTRLIFNKNE